jgi:AhpD family alkylhydroperoxidase
MRSRLNYKDVAPGVYRAMRALEEHVRASGLGRNLLHLVYLRVSQKNGCAFCVHMHARELRADGETDERIDAVSVWKETPFFSIRERAALAWAEAVTELGEGHVADAVFEEARRSFSDAELVELTLAVSTINAWNRLAIAFRSVPGQ